MHALRQVFLPPSWPSLSYQNRPSDGQVFLLFKVQQSILIRYHIFLTFVFNAKNLLPKKFISDYFLSRWLNENDSFFRLQTSDAHRHLPPKHEAFPVHALQLILPKVFKLVLPYRHQVLFIVKLFFASVCVTSGRQLYYLFFRF